MYYLNKLVQSQYLKTILQLFVRTLMHTNYDSHLMFKVLLSNKFHSFLSDMCDEYLFMTI